MPRDRSKRMNAKRSNRRKRIHGGSATARPRAPVVLPVVLLLTMIPLLNYMPT